MSPEQQSGAEAQHNPYATQLVATPEQSHVPRVVLVDARGEPVRGVELTIAGVTIGRLRSSSLVLEDPTVSRNHVRVDWDGRDARVVDLGSRLGTLLGTVRLEAQVPQPWPPELPIRIGRHTIRLQVGAPPATGAAAPVAAAPPAASVPSGAGAQPAALAAAAVTGRLASPADAPAAPPVESPPATGAAVPVAAAPPAASVPSGAGAQPAALAAAAVTGRLASPADAPAAPPVESPPVVAGGPAVTLALAPDQVNLMLEPGRRTIIDVQVTNQTAAPLTVSLSIAGLPRDWVEVMPTVRVVPDSRVAATMVVHVPQESASRAGAYPVTIEATAAEIADMVFEAPLEWRVAPFVAGTLSIAPKREADRELAVYTVSVRNDGNIHTSYTLGASDEAQALSYSFAQEHLTIAPGETVETPLTVAVERRLFGRDLRHAFTVQASGSASEEVPGVTLVAHAQFIQAATFPLWWVAVLAGLLLLALLCGFAVIPASLAGALPGYGILTAPTEPPDQRTTAVAAATSQAQALLVADLERRETLVALVQTATAAPEDQRVALQATFAAQFATASAIPLQLTALPTLPPPPDAVFATVAPDTPPASTIAPAGVTPSVTPSPTLTPAQTAVPTRTLLPRLPSLVIDDAAIRRLTTGEVTLSFPVRLSEASDATVTVQYETEDDTARAGDDYRSAVGTLSFVPGDVSGTIAVIVLPSSTKLTDVRLRVRLTSATGANLDDGEAVGTILAADNLLTATPTATVTPQPAATATATATPQPAATATATATPQPAATATATATPQPTATSQPTATPTATPTFTATPVSLTIDAPGSFEVPTATWTGIPVSIAGVPDEDTITVTLSVTGTPTNGAMRILGPGGFGPTAGPQTFTTTLADANARLSRLEYRRFAAGTATMTIQVTHEASGAEETATIALTIVAP